MQAVASSSTQCSTVGSKRVRNILSLKKLTPVVTRRVRHSKRFAMGTTRSAVSRCLALGNNQFPVDSIHVEGTIGLTISQRGVIGCCFHKFKAPAVDFLGDAGPFNRIRGPIFSPMGTGRLTGRILKSGERAIGFLLPRCKVTQCPCGAVSRFVRTRLGPLKLSTRVIVISKVASQGLVTGKSCSLSVNAEKLNGLSPASLLFRLFSSGNTAGGTDDVRCGGPGISTYFRELGAICSLRSEQTICVRVLSRLLTRPTMIPLLRSRGVTIYDRRLNNCGTTICKVALSGIC